MVKQGIKENVKPNRLTLFTVTTGFPCYLKVEHFCEIFCKLKWCKVKKQLPLIFMEKFLSFPRHNKEPTKSYQ